MQFKSAKRVLELKKQLVMKKQQAKRKGKIVEKKQLFRLKKKLRLNIPWAAKKTHYGPPKSLPSKESSVDDAPSSSSVDFTGFNQLNFGNFVK